MGSAKHLVAVPLDPKSRLHLSQGWLGCTPAQERNLRVLVFMLLAWGRSCCSSIHALRRDIKTSIKRGRADLETNMPLDDTEGFKEHGGTAENGDVVSLFPPA